jgi:nucleotide-binding universal stress UspA family protein
VPTILLPTDFSDHALNACSYAFDLFGVTDTTYMLVHTYLDVLPGYDALVDMSGAQYADGVEAMAAFVERLRQLPQGREAVLVTHVVTGPLTSSLGELCSEQRVHAIVMGTQGASGLALFGSNASAVARNSQVPVLVVPRDARFTGLRTVLLADDQQPSRPQGLDLLVHLLERDRAHVVLAHVLRASSAQQATGLNSIRQALPPGLEVTSVQVSGTDVGDALSSLAERLAAELVVVQHRHLGFLPGLFHTSTAVQLALHSRIPLLVLEAGRL